MHVDDASSHRRTALSLAATMETQGEAQLLGKAGRDAGVAIAEILLRTALQSGAAPIHRIADEPPGTNEGQEPFASAPATGEQR